MTREERKSVANARSVSEHRKHDARVLNSSDILLVRETAERE